MPVILGLDVGDKRVGVAISDSKQLIARTYGVFLRANYSAEKQLIELINKNDIKAIVVGLPLTENDQISEQAEKIKNFCRRLEKRVPISIHYIDEYASSQAAKAKLGYKGKPSKAQRRSGEIDAEAAKIILQDYINQGLRKEVD